MMLVSFEDQLFKCCKPCFSINNKHRFLFNALFWEIDLQCIGRIGYRLLEITE